MLWKRLSGKVIVRETSVTHAEPDSHLESSCAHYGGLLSHVLLTRLDVATGINYRVTTSIENMERSEK